MNASTGFRLAFFLWFGFVSLPVRAQQVDQPFVLSERVGEVIEEDERNYFGLFPHVQDFRTARVHRLMDSMFFFRIESGRDGTVQQTSILLPERTVTELARYIDQFETLYDDTGAVQWGDLIDVARPRKPFRRSNSLKVVRTDISVVQGRLLYADEQLLLVTEAGSCPACISERTQFNVLFPAQIAYVEERPRFPVNMLSNTRIFLGGDPAAYRQALPILTEWVYVRDVSPPEVRDYLADASSADSPTEAPQGVRDDAFVPTWNVFVLLSGAFYSHAIKFPQQTDEAPSARHVSAQNLVSPRPTLHTSVHANRQRLWAAAGVHRFSDDASFGPQGYVSLNGRRLHVTTAAWVVTGLAGITFNPLNPFGQVYDDFWDGLNKVEVRVGLGVAYARLRAKAYTIRHKLDPSSQRAYVDYSPLFSRSSHWGASATASAAVRIMDRIVLHLASQAVALPNVSVQNPGVEQGGGTAGDLALIQWFSLGLRLVLKQ